MELGSIFPDLDETASFYQGAYRPTSEVMRQTDVEQQLAEKADDLTRSKLVVLTAWAAACTIMPMLKFSGGKL